MAFDDMAQVARQTEEVYYGHAETAAQYTYAESNPTPWPNDGGRVGQGVQQITHEEMLERQQRAMIAQSEIKAHQFCVKNSHYFECKHEVRCNCGKTERTEVAKGL